MNGQFVFKEPSTQNIIHERDIYIRLCKKDYVLEHHKKQNKLPYC
jgi:hypothetical protein